MGIWTIVFSTTFLFLTCLIPSNAAADYFAKGAKRGSIILGSGRSFDEDYVIVGLGGGYHFVDNVELGLNVQSWLGGNPDIHQVTPELTYTFNHVRGVYPYAGILYRKTFISENEDLKAKGGRVGLHIDTGNRSYVSFGLIGLEYEGCRESIFLSCSETYPEFTFAIDL